MSFFRMKYLSVHNLCLQLLPVILKAERCVYIRERVSDACAKLLTWHKEEPNPLWDFSECTHIAYRQINSRPQLSAAGRSKENRWNYWRLLAKKKPCIYSPECCAMMRFQPFLFTRLEIFIFWYCLFVFKILPSVLDLRFSQKCPLMVASSGT
jgi:hypothetical protein